MLKNLFIITLFAGLLYSCSGVENSEVKNDFNYAAVSNVDSVNNFVVIELFTSEGCSSCPAADDTVSKILKENKSQKKNVIIVAEHVDYWNDLLEGKDECKGKWVDVFSTGEFTARQFAYANKLENYPATPQIVVNGKEMLSDLSEENINSAINKYFPQPCAMTINLSLNEKSDFTNGKLLIDYSAKKNKEVIGKEKIAPQLIIYLVESNLVTRPNKGENCWAELHHNNVAVASISKTIRSLKGSLELNVPDGVKLENCTIVGVVQNLFNLEMLGGTNGFDFKKL